MRAAVPLLLALLLLPLLAGAGLAQLPSPTLPVDPLPLLQEKRNETLATGERVAATYLDVPGGEDVRIRLEMNFSNLDFDTVGILFGGGKFEANAKLEAHIEFRVLSSERIRALVNREAGTNLLGNETQPLYVTAGHFRTTLAGEALAAFEEAEAKAIAKLMEDSFPGLTILNARFAWSNVSPSEGARPSLDDLDLPDGDASPTQTRLYRGFETSREPPIVLDADFDLQYIKRESIVNLLDQSLRSKSAQEQRKASEYDRRLEELRNETEGAFYERSAFSILGIHQLIELRMDPGWDLELDLRLPPPYTIESASADVILDDARRAASTALEGRSATQAVSQPVVVSLSSRYLVTVALLAITLVAGAVLRFPVTLVANRIRRGRDEPHRR